MIEMSKEEFQEYWASLTEEEKAEKAERLWAELYPDGVPKLDDDELA